MLMCLIKMHEHPTIYHFYGMLFYSIVVCNWHSLMYGSQLCQVFQNKAMSPCSRFAYNILSKPQASITYFGSMRWSRPSVFFFSSSSWCVLSATKSSRFVWYFSIIVIMLSKMLVFLEQRNQQFLHCHNLIESKNQLIWDQQKLTFLVWNF